MGGQDIYYVACEAWWDPVRKHRDSQEPGTGCRESQPWNEHAICKKTATPIRQLR